MPKGWSQSGGADYETYAVEFPGVLQEEMI